MATRYDYAKKRSTKSTPRSGRWKWVAAVFGIVLVSGMIIGTAFTLFVVPAIYMFVARVRKPVAEKAAAVVAPATLEPAVELAPVPAR